ncbi:hypothetical protein CLOM_g7631 [Closterium sp. NIES-68]|nr:hypothetical protein CLOM_g7631 [Closterium sp. NIES-68]
MAAPAPAPSVAAVGPTEAYAVVGNHFCVPYETVLIMKEKMFSLSGKADIRDSQGNLMFRLQGNAFSVSKQKTFFDPNDKPVCTLTSKVFSLHNTTYLCTGDSTDTNGALLMAKKNILSFTPVLNVFLKGNTSDNPDIVLQGSFIHHQFDISTSKGVKLARVERELFSAQELLGSQSYAIRIMPNVDMALILGLVTMADDIFVDAKHHHHHHHHHGVRVGVGI